MHVYDWSTLNGWPIKKVYLLTTTWESLCSIDKRLTHANATSKKVKPIVRVWFSVLIYQIFKGFMEAMKYNVFEVTVTRVALFVLFL